MIFRCCVHDLIRVTMERENFGRIRTGCSQVLDD